MHAGFPCLLPNLQKTLKLGANAAIDAGELPAVLDKAQGRLLAGGMAVALRLGFGYLLRDCQLDAAQAAKANAFFEENFIIIDPLAPGGQRYYQGKFLIRTSRRGDDMNVLLKFCPNPDALYIDTPFGRALNSLALVATEVLDENQADRIENDPSQVDLVVRFKDVQSIIGLLGRSGVDIVGLLLENLVQLTGHVGHLFKLGAIATDIQLSLDIPKAA
ncbi:hypothetical protein PL263_14340 [Methylomonas sp. EFPC3]|uniref:hypothetical protein n=1 Tax=Methylomonas sp. EFPC3 TaxID=3021710 RepID=UPI0024168F6C|nr:hypothetical protein [Methylomonas sp. EFPC3]WFP49274.1 hypothetical protein PL263_14340 [Methylomonas sp. EFPC3]